MTAIQLLWFILGTSWAILECFIAFKTRVGVTSNAQNRYRSEQLIWLVVIVALFCALWFKGLHLLPLPFNPIVRQTLAVLLFSSGFVLRACAVLTLRQFFSTSVTIQDQHKLIQIGPYQRIRHPAYTGLLLSFCGAGIGMGDVLALIVLVIPIIYVLLQRIQVEEQWLSAHFGERYIDYSGQTQKLIPWFY
ncbi:methyltransferase family protein [Crenothrix polyspora]|uniref:Isoprenylcysteine carboxyl methyltransferase n=1 Tax=Crenothrix polyspora TaxID=360316 RepID=A0A1R4H8B1_9GAMM|nr:isoprenylcysteine carboxylmethyltransferase family protein [Crenothrix polyspora]SJM92407.1 Isoprenylcysteine carboxyl methyltransferase [Crenothrix polyspora]